jgi:hypothetical protein
MSTHHRSVAERWFRHSLPVAIVLAAGLIYFFVGLIRENLTASAPSTWGVTFSDQYAKQLGLDWKRVYVEMLDDLGVRAIRIPVYWNEVETVRGKFDFSDVDWMLQEAEKRDAKVILVVGRRVPRWPECHTPNWAHELDLHTQNERVLALVRAEVTHFKKYGVISYWQVENEPLLDVFGVCPKGDTDFLGQERRLVKALDSTRPILVTDSGELSLWLPSGFYADVLGISMYKVTWNRWFGYFYYPITPAFYQKKATAIFPIVKKVIITELQAEPWPASNRAITDTPVDEQYKSMDIERFRSNVEFARRVGFSETYLWGVEWWYWIRTHGDPSFWNEARNLFTTR